MGGKCDKGKGPKPLPSRSKGELTLEKKLTEGVKIVLLGDMSTGKTCMVLRLVNNKFDENKEPTIGAAFLVHKMPVAGRTVKLEIWDTAGQERFRSLSQMYYRGATAAIIVYDITSATSFDVMKGWIDELKEKGPPNIFLAIAGNKCDLAEHRAVQPSAVEAYLAQLCEGGGRRPIFRECSAKSGEGVQQLFEDICKSLIDMAQNGN